MLPLIRPEKTCSKQDSNSLRMPVALRSAHWAGVAESAFGRKHPPRVFNQCRVEKQTPGKKRRIAEIHDFGTRLFTPISLQSCGMKEMARIQLFSGNAPSHATNHPSEGFVNS